MKRLPMNQYSLVYKTAETKDLIPADPSLDWYFEKAAEGWDTSALLNEVQWYQQSDGTLVAVPMTQYAARILG